MCWRSDQCTVRYRRGLGRQDDVLRIDGASLSSTVRGELRGPSGSAPFLGVRQHDAGMQTKGVGSPWDAIGALLAVLRACSWF